METLIKPPIEWAVAALAERGERESGDHYVALATPDVGLVAVVDGLGHGAEAARAARTAVRALGRGAARPLVQMLPDCCRTMESAWRAAREELRRASRLSLPDHDLARCRQRAGAPASRAGLPRGARTGAPGARWRRREPPTSARRGGCSPPVRRHAHPRHRRHPQRGPRRDPA